MLLLTLLTVVSRASSLAAWPIAQLIIISLLGVGTALVSVLCFNDGRLFGFLLSPLVMPTITLVWALILVVTHIRADGIFRCRKRLKWRTTTVEDRPTAASPIAREPGPLPLKQQRRHSQYEVREAQDAAV